jgi:hypothetical protein
MKEHIPYHCHCHPCSPSQYFPLLLLVLNIKCYALRKQAPHTLVLVRLLPRVVVVACLRELLKTHHHASFQQVVTFKLPQGFSLLRLLLDHCTPTCPFSERACCLYLCHCLWTHQTHYPMVFTIQNVSIISVIFPFNSLIISIYHYSSYAMLGLVPAGLLIAPLPYVFPIDLALNVVIPVHMYYGKYL